MCVHHDLKKCVFQIFSYLHEPDLRDHSNRKNLTTRIKQEEIEVGISSPSPRQPSSFTANLR